MNAPTASAQALLRRSTFIVHAPNASVLRDLFVSDLERKIAELEARAQATKKASEGEKIAYVLAELRALVGYWREVEITGGRKRNG